MHLKAVFPPNPHTRLWLVLDTVADATKPGLENGFCEQTCDMTLGKEHLSPAHPGHSLTQCFLFSLDLKQVSWAH